MIRVTFAVATFITYAVQFYVPVQILWPAGPRPIDRLDANLRGIHPQIVHPHCDV